MLLDLFDQTHLLFIMVLKVAVVGHSFVRYLRDFVQSEPGMNSNLLMDGVEVTYICWGGLTVSCLHVLRDQIEATALDIIVQSLSWVIMM